MTLSAPATYSVLFESAKTWRNQSRGMTGSASWYLFTLITQVFGIRGHGGDLLIDPKLMPDQFDADGIASIRSHFAGREFVFEFHNAARLAVTDYQIAHILLDDSEIEFVETDNHVVVSRKLLETLAADKLYQIKIELK